MPELGNTGDRYSLASNGASINARVWASKTPAVFHGARVMWSLKDKKVGGMDKKVETILGDQLSQLVLQWKRLMECGMFAVQARRVLGTRRPYLTSGFDKGGEGGCLMVKSGGFRALPGSLAGKDPISSHVLLPGHTPSIES